MRSPITSTHLTKSDGVYLRVTNEMYADCYQHGKWQQSAITNEEILITHRNKYVKILHTGIDRTLANAFQWSIGSMYRIKKIKIY